MTKGLSEEVEKLRDELLSIFCVDKVINTSWFSEIQKYRYLLNNSLIAKFFSDQELVDTAILFFENNLNISFSSKQGFMHRNTLIYRIDKIKNIIGLDIRNFTEAVVLQGLICFHSVIESLTKNFKVDGI